MKKNTFKEWIIIFLSVALFILVVLLLTKEDLSKKNIFLEQEIKKQEMKIKSLKIENDKLNKEIQEISYDVITAYKKIDSLSENLKNRKPIIKYIIKKIQDEKKNSFVIPNDSQLDSFFTSKLLNR